MVEYSRLTRAARPAAGDDPGPRTRFDRILLDTGAGISDVVLFSKACRWRRVVLVVSAGAHGDDRCLRHRQGLATRQQRGLIRLVVNQTTRLGEARTVRGRLQRVVDHYVNAGAAQSRQARPGRRDPVGRRGARGGAKRQLLLEVYPGSSAAIALAVIALAAKLAPEPCKAASAARFRLQQHDSAPLPPSAARAWT